MINDVFRLFCAEEFFFLLYTHIFLVTYMEPARCVIPARQKVPYEASVPKWGNNIFISCERVANKIFFLNL